MAIHSSTIAWKIPWTEEPGRLQSMGSQRVGSGETQEQELREKLRPLMARLPRGQQLTAILITDDPLPRTATGKIKRWEVQQKAGLL